MGIVAILVFFTLLPTIYPIILFFGIPALLGYLFDLWEEQQNKTVEMPKSIPPPNPNPYTLEQRQNPNPYNLEELQNHLDNYCRKALRSGNLDKWKYGRDYERYIGYLWEKDGYKVIYNGAVEGVFDGGIDLICICEDECILIQCKRWKNTVSKEYIKRLNYVAKKFQRYHPEYSEVKPYFYTTSDYTKDAYNIADKYDIECCIEKFNSVREYPPVKCLIHNGDKIYYLPFDKEFDRISVENGCDYKFKIADAERAGYHYHLNHDVLLKLTPPAPRPKIPYAKKLAQDRWFKFVTECCRARYWDNDKNFPVGYFHAGCFEFINLNSCKIHSCVGGKYIFSAKFIVISLPYVGYNESIRIFRYGSGFPQIYSNGKWKDLPKYREYTLEQDGCFINYIENQMRYSYIMFKIVYYALFKKEYSDSEKYGWHYNKGYPEYITIRRNQNNSISRR